MNTLTQERLKQLLMYCPDTGDFYWIVSKSNIPAGSKAGSVNSSGYVSIMADKQRHYAHRLAFLYMLGRMPTHEVDHINGNPRDNRWINLREVPHSANLKNVKLQSRNVSGQIGVIWDASRLKWKAQIRVNGKQINLGRFDDLDEAIKARRDASSKHNFHENHGRSSP